MYRRLILIHDAGGNVVAYDPEMEKGSLGNRLENERGSEFLLDMEHLSMRTCVLFSYIEELSSASENIFALAPKTRRLSEGRKALLEFTQDVANAICSDMDSIKAGVLMDLNKDIFGENYSPDLLQFVQRIAGRIILRDSGRTFWEHIGEIDTEDKDIRRALLGFAREIILAVLSAQTP